MRIPSGLHNPGCSNKNKGIKKKKTEGGEREERDGGAGREIEDPRAT